MERFSRPSSCWKSRSHASLANVFIFSSEQWPCASDSRQQARIRPSSVTRHTLNCKRKRKKANTKLKSNSKFGFKIIRIFIAYVLRVSEGEWMYDDNWSDRERETERWRWSCCCCCCYRCLPSCNKLGHRIAANTCVTGAHLQVVAAKWSFWLPILPLLMSETSPITANKRDPQVKILCNILSQRADRASSLR